ncbi:MAG TPA: V-type ATP synthase subunit D [Thermoplasmata archaeon]|nr:V-type ATP synthase subunit D [Thermoplasmata archaeon]
MVIENVRPTRLELLRTRRRIVLARKGLKLLKLKRSALIAEFFSLSKEALKLRGDLQSRIARGYDSIRRAEMDVGPIRLESIAMLLPDLARVSVGTKNVMGVRTPRVDSGGFAPVPETALLQLPATVHESVRHFQQIYRVVLDIAEKENALRRLLRDREDEAAGERDRERPHPATRRDRALHQVPFRRARTGRLLDAQDRQAQDGGGRACPCPCLAADRTRSSG